MAKVMGLGHASFTVMDLDRTIHFYVDLLGGNLLSTTVDEGAHLGNYVMGKEAQPHAKLRVAMVELGGIQIEFLQYVDPKTAPYHGNPSVAVSGHLAFEVDDIEEMVRGLTAKGVVFHSQVNDCVREGKLEWRWVYLRDPDNICCELVEMA